MFPPGLALRALSTRPPSPFTQDSDVPLSSLDEQLESRPAQLTGANSRDANLTMGLIDAIPSAGPQAVPMAGTTEPGGSNILQKLGLGVKGVGKSIAQNPGTSLAVLQGIGGLISYATAQAPKPLSAPAPYTPPIRAAQGLEASSYDQARKDILGSQTVAATADSADAASSTVQRLLGQRQATGALTTLAGQNNQAYQTDRARVADQEGAAYGKNYDGQRVFAENQYNDQRRQYEARRTQTGAMVQGAIDSISGAVQQKQQATELANETKNRQTEAEITQLHNSLGSATSDEQRQTLLKRLGELDPNSTRLSVAQQRYGQPTKLASGGLLTPSGVSFSAPKAGKAAGAGRTSAHGRTGKNAPPVSVQTFHQLSQDFAKHLDTFSTQARAAFDRSLQTATRLRATGIGSSVLRAR